MRSNNQKLNFQAAAREAQAAHDPLVIWPEDKLLADTGEEGARLVVENFPVLNEGPQVIVQRPKWRIAGYTTVALANSYFEWASQHLKVGDAYGFMTRDKKTIVRYDSSTN